MINAAFLPPQPVVEELRELTGRLSVLGMTPVPPDQLYVLITRFGNLTEDVVLKLGQAMADHLAGVQRAAVSFGAPRMGDGGEVVVSLEGELDLLNDLARAVPMIAEHRRLYVDRRVFRPQLVVATTGLDPSSLLVERLLSGSARWSSQVWETDGISLMRTRWHAGKDRSEEFLFVPLDERASL
ncbi:MAG TPA: hypothetical protein VNS55_00740 [Nocardioides sp.]|nr:hypothetical protein [Nocardioides sp.]